MSLHNSGGVPNNAYGFPEKTYTIAEIAVILGVSIRTVFTLRKFKILPYHQKGKRGSVYFTDEDIAVCRQRMRRNGD